MLYEPLLGRRLERVRDHFGARVAVFLSGGRVCSSGSSLPAGLCRERRQRPGRQQQRQQRSARAERPPRRSGHPAGRLAGLHPTRTVLAAPAVHTVTHVVHF